MFINICYKRETSKQGQKEWRRRRRRKGGEEEEEEEEEER